MVVAQHALLVGQQLDGQPQRLTRVAHFAGAVRYVATRPKRVGVVMAQQALLVRQQLCEKPQRLTYVAQISGTKRNPLARLQRIGMTVAQARVPDPTTVRPTAATPAARRPIGESRSRWRCGS